MTVVVATTDFEIYHDVVNELHDRGIQFTTIQPADHIPVGASVVITGPTDPVEPPDGIPQLVAARDDPRKTVERAVTIHTEPRRRIVGIDPGDRPGIAVLAGPDIVATYQVPLADAPDIVREAIADAPDPVVRIGDGARLQGTRLIDELEDVTVELVDETASTPHLGTGTHGMGDVLAAVNIARRAGDPIQARDIEPTPGEIQVIQSESRKQAPDNRTISAALARRVATGDLTLAEALEEHRTG